MKKISANVLILILLFLAGIILLQACKKHHIPPNNNPAITAFAPASGPLGATITINGAGFNADASQNQVTFNGVTAVVSAATATQLKVIVPAGAGDGKISVNTGSLVANSANDFKYLYTVSTLAGDGTVGHNNGTGAGARFDIPIGLAVNMAGNIYVADYGNNLVRQVTSAGVVTTFAVADNNAPLNAPAGVAFDGAGNAYIADTYNNQILKITPGGVVSTLAGSGTAGFANGTGTAAQFAFPFGIAVDNSGNVYVADTHNNRIRKITPQGVVSTLAGDGNAGLVNGDGAAAEFDFPNGVAVDAAGNVYVADTRNNVIRKILPSGTVSTFAGNGAAGLADGMGAAAQFNYPCAVATDVSNNVYVADTHNHAIRKITPAGIVSILAGGGSYGFADGVGTSAHFFDSHGIAVDMHGNVYVGDTGNSSIRKIQ